MNKEDKESLLIGIIFMSITWLLSHYLAYLNGVVEDFNCIDNACRLNNLTIMTPYIFLALLIILAILLIPLLLYFLFDFIKARSQKYQQPSS